MVIVWLLCGACKDNIELEIKKNRLPILRQSILFSLFLYRFLVQILLRVANGACFADNRDTNLARISHLVLDTLSDVE